MSKSRIVRMGLCIILVVLFGLFLYFFNKDSHESYINQGSATDIRYERAKIIRVVAESLEKDKAVSGLYRGTQDLEVKILTGARKGETYTVKNYLSNLFNVYGKAGMNIIVSIDSAGNGDSQISVYNYYRSPVIYFFILIFFAALWGIGGIKGMKSILGLVFTFTCIIFLFIPMLYKGYSPVFASVVIVILTTCVTLFLIDGWSSKTLSAILGTILGVVIAGLVSCIAGSLAHISGFSSEEAETLIVIASNTHMQVGGLLFAGILIASLGAIMDIGMSIASAVYEIYLTDTKQSRRKLFISGINVGRDMMGTMANTLILAFTGASLNSLILIYSYNVPFNQLINMNMMSIEVIQGLSGTIAVILTVPIISFISSQIIPALKLKRYK